jgi:methionyl-tRNA formyltransferase
VAADWGKSWRQIDPLIRGCSPAPGAWTTINGATLQIFEAKPVPASDPKGIGGKIGEIVEIVDVSDPGFTVVCADGRFQILRVKPADGGKVAAGEFVKSANVAVGTRLV